MRNGIHLLRSQEVELLKRRLIDQYDPAKITIEHAKTFVGTGRFTIEDAFPDDCVPIIIEATKKAVNRPLPVTRRVTDPPGCIEAYRATMFRFPVGLDQRLHGLKHLSPELLILAQWSDLVARTLAVHLKEIGREDMADIISHRTTSRVVAHEMRGTPKKNAVFAPHIDKNPIEKTLNMVVEPEPTNDLVTGEQRRGNTVSVFAVQELIEMFEIPEEPHGVISDCFRRSLVLTCPEPAATKGKMRKLAADVLRIGN